MRQTLLVHEIIDYGMPTGRYGVSVPGRMIAESVHESKIEAEVMAEGLKIEHARNSQGS